MGSREAAGMREHLRLQAGVVSRTQLLASGLDADDVRRLLRRRELAVLRPGVYLDHTGRPSSVQEAWGAVLALWPAVLSHESAVWVDAPAGRTHPPGLIHVAVARERRVVTPPGIRVHRTDHLDARALWRTRPPRIRLEEALVDVASSARDEMTAVAALSGAVQARRTSAVRVAAALAGRERVPRRAFLREVLEDVGAGTGSVLEREYLKVVERAHVLPRGIRQVRDGSAVRDVVYEEQRLVVELDGRDFHDGSERRAADLERDLAAAVRGFETVRLGWAQVFGHPCETTSKVAALLAQRGWTGRPVACDRPLCGAVLAPHAPKAPRRR